MPREINYEKEIIRKIRITEHALSITPYPNIKEAAMKELEKLYNELKEIRNPK